jgi:hypothetical protein
MVYNTQNYWVFGPYPLFRILETRKHRKIQTFHEDYLLRVCENMFGKIENKFLGGRCWGRKNSILLIIENGEITNMSIFVLVKYYFR